ncbi:hypothetical protein AAHC03_01523 [Spirometra sp. Aus1]
MLPCVYLPPLYRLRSSPPQITRSRVAIFCLTRDSVLSFVRVQAATLSTTRIPIPYPLWTWLSAERSGASLVLPHL